MWEAISMAHRITRKNKTILSSGVHPHYVSVARTMAKFTEDRLETSLPELTAATDAGRLIAGIDDQTSAVVVQYPDILGRIADLTPIAEAAHAAGALLIAVVTEPVALGLIKSPGEMGADIVVGEGQSIGVGLQFGGPYVGLFDRANLEQQRLLEHQRPVAGYGRGFDSLAGRRRRPPAGRIDGHRIASFSTASKASISSFETVSVTATTRPLASASTSG
jgi:hypothetical protein